MKALFRLNLSQSDGDTHETKRMDSTLIAQHEELLLERAQNGDAEAFCQLAELHENHLLNQAMFMCRELSNAQDLAQQTLLEAWKSLSRFDQRCRFSTWLFSILWHRYQKSLRSAKSRPIPWSSLPSPSADELARQNESLPGKLATPDQALLREENHQLLRRSLEALPAKHQQVIWLRFFEDASLEEIAAALRLPLGTIKSRLHHGLEKLRRISAKMNLYSPGEES